jgi:hypothetical protein
MVGINRTEGQQNNITDTTDRRESRGAAFSGAAGF